MSPRPDYFDLDDVLQDCRTRVPTAPGIADVHASACQMILRGESAASGLGFGADEVHMADWDTLRGHVAAAREHLGAHQLDPTSIHGTFEHLSRASQRGWTSRIKGTDFEIQAVHRLNDGLLGPLPPGVDHVDLAAGLTQPGYDAIGVDAAGQAVPGVEYQMKATSDWHVIARHLSRYPQYPDVVATSEVANGSHAAASTEDVPGGVEFG